MEKKKYLLLENGKVFEGKSFGAGGDITGEVVFTTAMTGYLETLTDPSYYGQIVIQTFPLIGNYGVIPEDFESRKSFVKGYIVRDWCQEPSNFRNQGDLDTFLREQNIPGIYGIDTRALTRMVRENGVMNGMLLSELPEDIDAAVAELKKYTIVEAVASTSTDKEEHYNYKDERPDWSGLCDFAWPPEELGDKPPKKVVLLDLGAKRNIARELSRHGCDVTVVPYDTKADEIIAMKPDGIMLSNGPGDPKECTGVIREIKKLYDTEIPIFAICLGHQLMALATGADTHKMKYGHRGGNHPVKDLATGRVYISSQNHGYVVDMETLDPKVATPAFVNVNDGTNEGLAYTGKNIFTVQFHPEASPGPRDSGVLFDRFMKMMEVKKNA